MVGKRRVEKKCVECGKKISGFKDYCTACHEKLLQKIRKSRKNRKF
jgi:predicted amidophosphoribosyltransferase